MEPSEGGLKGAKTVSWEKEKLRAMVKKLLEWYLSHPGGFHPDQFSQDLKGQIQNTLSDEYFSTLGGVFFTLYKKGDLRGCMGNISSGAPYRSIIPRQVHMAAFEDPRFPDLGRDELGELCGEFTFLGPLVDAKNWQDWELGTHGIQLTLDFSRAVFLPKVPIEQKWDKETTLQHLCLKAGLDRQAYLTPRAQFKIFRGETVDLGQL
jgi:AmmeMemoRadiSam system protein A